MTAQVKFSVLTPVPDEYAHNHHYHSQYHDDYHLITYSLFQTDFNLKYHTNQIRDTCDKFCTVQLGELCWLHQKNNDDDDAGPHHDHLLGHHQRSSGPLPTQCVRAA